MRWPRSAAPGSPCQGRCRTGEGRELAVLGQVEAERAGHLLHGLDLGAGRRRATRMPT